MSDPDVILVVSSKRGWVAELERLEWRFISYSILAQNSAPKLVHIASGNRLVGTVEVKRMTSQFGGMTSYGTVEHYHRLTVVELRPATAKAKRTPVTPTFEGRPFRLIPGNHHYMRRGKILSKNAEATPLPEVRKPSRSRVGVTLTARSEASSLLQERDLVTRFVKRLGTELGDVTVEKRVARGAARLDLWVATRRTIIEAKWPLTDQGEPLTRSAVRMAVGQLLDYRSLASVELGGVDGLAVLLPAAPPRSVQAFLEAVHIGAIWETSRGVFTDSLGGRWLSGRELCPLGWRGPDT